MLDQQWAYGCLKCLVRVLQAGMFNDESTHKERVQVLQSLMSKGTGDVGSGVHTPREINQLLARTDDEFRTFQQVHALPTCLSPCLLPHEHPLHCVHARQSKLSQACHVKILGTSHLSTQVDICHSLVS